MKPTYIDLPPFEWQVFYANMSAALHETLDGMKAALREWLDNPPSKDVDPRCSRSGPRTSRRRC